MQDWREVTGHAEGGGEGRAGETERSLVTYSQYITVEYIDGCRKQFLRSVRVWGAYSAAAHA